MPVRVKGKALGPSNEQLLDWLASIWVEAREVGAELRRLDRKVHKQNAWLWANEGHPLHAGRLTQAIVTAKEFDYYMSQLYRLAKKADEFVALMDASTKAEALACISAWATLGGAGIYAAAWGFAPVPLERQEEAA